MNRTASGFLLLAVISAALLLPACRKAYHEKNELYILVGANIELPYWQEARAGLLHSAHTLGVQAEVTGPASYDPEEQLRAFEAAVQRRPAGILVSPTRPDLFVEPINAAIREGIPVICVDSDAPDSNRLLFVGTDNFQAGMASGRQMAENLRGEGSVLVITIPGQLNLEQRLRGVRAVFEQHPNLSVTRVVDDRGDPVVAYDEVSRVLGADPNINGILALEASGGRGAAEALQRLNLDRKIHIVAMDKNPSTLDWIERRVISATIAQKPYTMTFYGLRFLDDLHHNVVREFKDWRSAPVSPLPTQVDTGTAVIHLGNLADFRQALAVHVQEAP